MRFETVVLGARVASPFHGVSGQRVDVVFVRLLLWTVSAALSGAGGRLS